MEASRKHNYVSLRCSIMYGLIIRRKLNTLTVVNLSGIYFVKLNLYFLNRYVYY